MAEVANEFLQFLQAWSDKRIVAFGVAGVEAGSRETLLKNRARELTDIARKRGFLSQLSTHANPHGDVRGYLSSLYRALNDNAPKDVVQTPAG